MNRTTQELIDTLSRQTAAYRRLLTTLQREQEALIVLDFDMLKHAGTIKADLVQECRKLEEEWLARHTRLARTLGCLRTTPSFTDLAEKLPPDQAAELWQIVSELLPLSQQIQEANTATQELLSHSVGMVHGALALLHNLQPSLPVYDRAGKTPVPSPSGRFISGNV